MTTTTTTRTSRNRRNNPDPDPFDDDDFQDPDQGGQGGPGGNGGANDGGTGGGGPGRGGGGGGGGPPGPNNNPGQQQPNIGIGFALSPARALQGIIDYGTRSGQKTWETSTAPLPMEYDLNPENLRAFIDAVCDRAKSSNWETTMLIHQDGEDYDLCTHYGHIRLESIRAHATGYLGQPNRNAQNSFQIYNCLSASLTDSARNEVATKKNDFIVGDMPDGLLYFKCIIKCAQVDTKATITTLRNKLSSLDEHMVEVDSDIKQFNLNVKGWYDSLKARGQDSQDLLVNLFRGYKACSDPTFRIWISNKEDSYNEGTNFTVDELMELAINKYTTLVDANLWKEPTEEEKKIIALTAALDKLKATRQPKSGKTGKEGTRYGKKRGTKKSNDGKQRKKRDYPEWKLVRGDGNPDTKMVNGKTYYWCPTHKMWTTHKPSECKKAKQSSSSDGEQKEPTKSQNDDKGSKLQINSGLMAIVEEDSE